MIAGQPTSLPVQSGVSNRRETSRTSGTGRLWDRKWLLPPAKNAQKTPAHLPGFPETQIIPADIRQQFPMRCVSPLRPLYRKFNQIAAGRKQSLGLPATACGRVPAQCSRHPRTWQEGRLQALAAFYCSGLTAGVSNKSLPKIGLANAFTSGTNVVVAPRNVSPC